MTADSVAAPPGDGGQLTVARGIRNGPLRKVPTPGATGAGGNPPGESASDGAETTQLGGTVKALRWRILGDMLKRPPSREQAQGDGRKPAPRPSR
jgi:hypothetical protein